jgi:hypothetical protein
VKCGYLGSGELGGESREGSLGLLLALECGETDAA